jgi:uncharacterized RDD family membrane protein YckC
MVTDSAPAPSSPAGFWLRFAAAIIDLVVLAVPFAAFVLFLSVAMRISTEFLDLRPGIPPGEVLMKFGPRFLYISLGFFLLLSWTYFATLESSSWRATLGKRALGLYVADTNGSRVTLARASGRFLSGRFLAHVPPLGLYYFLIDCACAGLTPRKQALHDLLSSCLVLCETPGSRLS